MTRERQRPTSTTSSEQNTSPSTPQNIPLPSIDNKVIVLADFKGTGEPPFVPVPMNITVFERTRNTLHQKGLTPVQMAVGGGIIFLAAAVTGKLLIDRYKEDNKRKSTLKDKHLPRVHLRSAKDEARLRDFMERFSIFREQISKYVYYRVDDQYDAEALVAKVYENALGGLHNYKRKPFINKQGELIDYQPWLYTIAGNLIKNYYRDQSRRKKRELYLEVLKKKGKVPSVYSPQLKEELEGEEILNLRTLLSTYGPEMHETWMQILYLKFVENLTNQEIGSILERNEGEIKSLQHRAIKKLRKLMEKDK